MNFKQYYESRSAYDKANLKYGWYDPDSWFNDPNATTFTYHDSELYTAPGDMSHNDMHFSYDLRRGIKGLTGRISNPPGQNPWGGDPYQSPEPVQYISFWNHNPLDYKDLEDCLKEMLRRKLITPQAIVSTPVSHRFPVNKVKEQKFIQDVDVSKEAEKRKEIHTLQGQEKKKELLNRGVVPKSPNIVGRKLWALNSENFKDV